MRPDPSGGLLYLMPIGMGEQDSDQPTERRVVVLLSEVAFPAVDGLVVVIAKILEQVEANVFGLKQNLSAFQTAAGSSADLGHQLETTFAGAEVRIIQQPVC